jgi:hypothetical protein
MTPATSWSRILSNALPLRLEGSRCPLTYHCLRPCRECSGTQRKASGSQRKASRSQRKASHSTCSSFKRFLRSRRSASSPPASRPSNRGARTLPQIWQWNSPSVGSIRSIACRVLNRAPHPGLGHLYSWTGLLHVKNIPCN